MSSNITITYGNMPINLVFGYNYSSTNPQVAYALNNGYRSTLVANSPGTAILNGFYAMGVPYSYYVSVLSNTLQNPTAMSNNSQLTYFLTTNAEYGRINSNISTTSQLVNNGTKKILIGNNTHIVRV